MKRAGKLSRSSRLPRKGPRAKREEAAWTAGKEAVLARADGLCERCGRDCRHLREPLDVHHVVSRARAPGWSGLHDPSNLVGICRRCHAEIHEDPAGHPGWIKSAPVGADGEESER